MCVCHILLFHSQYMCAGGFDITHIGPGLASKLFVMSPLSPLQIRSFNDRGESFVQVLCKLCIYCETALWCQPLHIHHFIQWSSNIQVEEKKRKTYFWVEGDFNSCLLALPAGTEKHKHFLFLASVQHSLSFWRPNSMSLFWLSIEAPLLSVCNLVLIAIICTVLVFPWMDCELCVHQRLLFNVGELNKKEKRY